MSEVISLHIGSAGINIGCACWELYCLEHGVMPDGRLVEQDEGTRGWARALFSEASSGKLNPRCVFADTDPMAIDGVRAGSHGGLFTQDQLLAAKDGSAGVYTRARYTAGRDVMHLVADYVRKLAEACDSLQGILFFSAASGGAGAGLAGRLMEELRIDHSRPTKAAFAIWPSPRVSQSTHAPYNVAGYVYNCAENADLVTLADNESMYRICQGSLGVAAPSHVNINRLLAQSVSAFTAGNRFDGEVKVDLREMQTALAPYPAAKYLSPSYAPLRRAAESEEQPSTADSPRAFTPAPRPATRQRSTAEMTIKALESSSALVKGAGDSVSTTIACMLMYRGDVTKGDVLAPVDVMRRRLRFVDWNPSGLQYGISSAPPAEVPGTDLPESSRACAAFTNSSDIVGAVNRVEKSFDLLYSKRAYVHWFAGEGMEKGEFSSIRENLRKVSSDYEQMCTREGDDDEEEEEEEGG